MNEPVDVEAQFSADDRIRPMMFVWRGQRHQVASLGRQWETNGERHFLVMTADERVYELVYLIEKAGWRLRRAPEHFGRKKGAV